MTNQRDLLTAEQTARMLGIAVQTLANWRSRGSPIPYSKIGSRVCYRVEDVDAYINATRRYSTWEKKP